METEYEPAGEAEIGAALGRAGVPFDPDKTELRFVFGQGLVRKTPSALPCVALRCSMYAYTRPRQQGSQVGTSEASTPSRCPFHPRPSTTLLSPRILHLNIQLAWGLRLLFLTLCEPWFRFWQLLVTGRHVSTHYAIPVCSGNRGVVAEFAIVCSFS